MKKIHLVKINCSFFIFFIQLIDKFMASYIVLMIYYLLYRIYIAKAQKIMPYCSSVICDFTHVEFKATNNDPFERGERNVNLSLKIWIKEIEVTPKKIFRFAVHILQNGRFSHTVYAMMHILFCGCFPPIAFQHWVLAVFIKSNLAHMSLFENSIFTYILFLFSPTQKINFSSLKNRTAVFQFILSLVKSNLFYKMKKKCSMNIFFSYIMYASWKCWIQK